MSTALVKKELFVVVPIQKIYIDCLENEAK